MSELKGSRSNFDIFVHDIEVLSDNDRASIKEIFSKCSPTLPGHKFGSIVYLGTGGSADRINECKEIFTNPDFPIVTYEELQKCQNFYPIPPYWEEAKKIER